ncbi:hypothetical protein [Rhizobium sp. BE258]|jgi:hypothetical protein|uniref:hypothetical protein n=1 Tax=unclassified Rhizobium TaxID=2613769 RepID=UPI0028660025|nr:hypothetical protein [Rhizobium sp. BE258]MDR7146393.1 hypothetical protein [Rhizobium sp. BE258]
MATIVALADRRSQQPRRKDQEPVEAQILLFTGVRYERLTDAPKPRPVPRAPRVKSK